MIFRETELKGVFVIELEKKKDARGFFARTWCQQEFNAHGLDTSLVQCNISFNRKSGTLRGMHYQLAPYDEVKLVRCTHGSIYDVVIDLRPGSPTYKRHIGITLSADNYKMLYIPKGIAHGFQTLEDNTEIFYQMSEFYRPEYTAGVRWDDSTFDINWPPSRERIIAEKDRTWPDFSG